MANTYFDFKRFRIEQAACANKVSTDACVFGAILTRLIQHGLVLDVGTGSALLSLMLAQKHEAPILGIELEEACAAQAQMNVANSPFDKQISIEQADIRSFLPDKRFDWIVCNPPFFNNSSKNGDAKRNIARQTESLGPADWVSIIKHCAHADTTLALLLSNNDVYAAYQENLRQAGYTHQYSIELFDQANAACKRVVLVASQHEASINFPERFIYKTLKGEYTREFVALLKPYYLYL